MSRQADILNELVVRFNDRQPIEIERFFTADFQLDQPGGESRTGHAGARAMVDALLAIAPDVRLVICDMVEQGECVAVRWQVESSVLNAAMISFYRFVGGRIARDWGVAAQAAWRG